jgi:hypothetical protein
MISGGEQWGELYADRYSFRRDPQYPPEEIPEETSPLKLPPQPINIGLKALRGISDSRQQVQDLSN